MTLKKTLFCHARKEGVRNGSLFLFKSVMVWIKFYYIWVMDKLDSIKLPSEIVEKIRQNKNETGVSIVAFLIQAINEKLARQKDPNDEATRQAQQRDSKNWSIND